MSTPKNYTVQPCELCGQVAPCMQVSFFQNIGLVILRFSRTTKGMLCRPCIDSTFIRSSAISALFGWWGIISFFYTLVTLPLNVVTWGRAQTLPQPSAHYWKQARGGGAPGPSPTQGFDPPAASPYGPPAQGAHPPAAAHHSAGAASFGHAATPDAPKPPNPDIVGYGALGIAGVCIVATILISLVGIGMMVSPNQPTDPESGLICMVMGALGCGGPGLVAFGLGAFRLLAQKNS